MTIAYLLYQAENNSNTTAGGGRMTSKRANISGGFPSIPPNEQLAGVEHWRKVFAKVADVDNTPIVKATVFMSAPTTSLGTRGVFSPGTQRDTVATKSTRKYGTGVLHANISGGVNSLVVDFETGSAADLIVQEGDDIFIKDDDNEELNLTVFSIDWTGEQAAIVLSDIIENAYLASNTFVGSCYKQEDINTSISNVVKNLSTSTFDENQIELENLSTIEHTLTLTLTGADTFSAVSDKLGAMPNGSTASDYAPINPDFDLPYLTIPALAWGGTGTIGETVVLQTHPAALATFNRHTVSAGASAGTDIFPLAYRFER